MVFPALRAARPIAALAILLAPAGAQMTWSRLRSTAQPPPLQRPALAYDAARQRAVLVGGFATWEWDGATWTRRAAAPGVHPPVHAGCAMAWFEPRRTVVLFGGLGTTPLGWPAVLDQTWEWGGAAWRRRSPATAPDARANSALAFDAARGRIVLFGGDDLREDPRGDTWEWDGRDWTERRPDARPPARAHHALAWDRARRRVVLFGGRGPDGALDDTWEWDGRSWTRRNPASRPAPRLGHTLTYDRERERVVLFGGSDPRTRTWDDATWEWDGEDWSRRIGRSAPFARMHHAAAYDVGGRRVLMFGGSYAYGELADLWGYAPRVRGRTQTVGAGCGGGASAPTIAASGPAILGNWRFAVRLDQVGARTPTFVGLSSATARLTLGTCTIYPRLPFDLVRSAVSDAAGTAIVPVAIPSDPALRGIELHAQGGVLAPLALTSGLSILIGD